MAEEQLTDEELARRVLDGAEETVCPQCGRKFDTVQAMRGHLASHSRQKPGPPPKPDKPDRDKPKPSAGELLDAAGRAIVQKAVTNLKADAHILAIVAPHLGLTIAGQELDAKHPERLYVRSRAELAGELILEIRDADVLRQVLRILNAYNSVHEMTKGGELVASLGVAGLVDARAIPPDFTIQYGPFQIPVAEQTIGDVVAELDRRGLYTPQPGEQPPFPPAPGDEGDHPPFPPTGHQPGAEVVEGGVQNT